MEPNVLLFVALALATLAAAVKVVTAANVMRAALWLAVSFVSIAGVYFLLSAELLGVAQLLIYAGAVTTLIVFAVMLSDAASSNPMVRAARQGVVLPAAAVALVLAVSVLRTVLSADWPKAAHLAPDSLARLGRVLFTDMAVPNEVASVILLVALVGAIALSMKEGES